MSIKIVPKVILTIVVLLLLQSASYADVPLLINYRGYIPGKPGTQNFQIQFKIYHQASGGSPLWSETQPVDLFDGNFAVQLGSVSPLTIGLFSTDTLFVAVQLVGEDELAPRQQIVSVPYAFQADLLDGLDSSHYIQSNSSAWLKGLGISQETQSGALYNLLDIRVSQNDNNRSGMTIQGTPSGGDLGIRMSASGSGGEQWFIDATNGTSSLGGGLLAFMYYKESNIIIKPTSQTSQSTELQPDAIGPVIPPPIDIEPIPRGSWSSLMTLKNNGRVGILTNSPNYTLDVRGSIGNNNVAYHSDERWKKNIQTLNDSLDKITHLRGVQFDWRRDEYKDMNFPPEKQVGLIAQEVEKVIPEIVSEGDDGYKSVDYARLVPLLIESIKTQQEEIKQLRSELNQLKEASN